MHYRNKWCVDLNEGPLLFGLGIHGRTCLSIVGARSWVAYDVIAGAPLGYRDDFDDDARRSQNETP